MTLEVRVLAAELASVMDISFRHPAESGHQPDRSLHVSMLLAENRCGLPAGCRMQRGNNCCALWAQEQCRCDSQRRSLRQDLDDVDVALRRCHQRVGDKQWGCAAYDPQQSPDC